MTQRFRSPNGLCSIESVFHRKRLANHQRRPGELAYLAPLGDDRVAPAIPPLEAGAGLAYGLDSNHHHRSRISLGIFMETAGIQHDAMDRHQHDPLGIHICSSFRMHQNIFCPQQILFKSENGSLGIHIICHLQKYYYLSL